MKKFISLCIIAIQLSACSFHSSQFDLFRNFISPVKNSSVPEKNWVAYWVGKKIELYAINLEDQVIFADEKINIFYKDNQIYKITGLLPKNSTLEIESNNNSLLYKSDGKSIASDSCETRNLLSTNGRNKKHLQSCVGSKSGIIYENQVIFNSQGMIIGLEFKVHPDYNSLQLRMK